MPTTLIMLRVPNFRFKERSWPRYRVQIFEKDQDTGVQMLYALPTWQAMSPPTTSLSRV